MEIKIELRYLLIVKPTIGLNIMDLPRSQSEGGLKRRAVPKGTMLYAYDIHNFKGVPYARLVPQDPTRPEWVRVAEADHSVEYVDVEPLTPTGQNDEIAAALREIAAALRNSKA